MVGLILAGTVSQAISSAVELGLPEALAAGPQDLDALAARRALAPAGKRDRCVEAVRRAPCGHADEVSEDGQRRRPAERPDAESSSRSNTQPRGSYTAPR
jgi:hypothetical protein